MIWIFGLIIGLIIFGPGLWVKHVMAMHREERADFPGTGGELARHLLDYYGLADVSVETTTIGDHYDPERKVGAAYHLSLPRPYFHDLWQHPSRYVRRR